MYETITRYDRKSLNHFNNTVLTDHLRASLIQYAVTQYMYRQAPRIILKLEWFLNGIYIGKQVNTGVYDVLKASGGYIVPTYDSFKKLKFDEQINCLDFFAKLKKYDINKQVYHKLFAITFPEYLNTNIDNVNVFWFDHVKLEKLTNIDCAFSPLTIYNIKNIMPTDFLSNISKLNEMYQQAKKDNNEILLFQFRLLDRLILILSIKGHLSTSKIRRRVNTIRYRGYNINLTYNTLNTWLNVTITQFIKDGWLLQFMPSEHTSIATDVQNNLVTIKAHENDFLYVLNAFCPSLCRSYVIAYYTEMKRNRIKHSKNQSEQLPFTPHVRQILFIADNYRYTIDLNDTNVYHDIGKYNIYNNKMPSTPGLKLIPIRCATSLYSKLDRARMSHKFTDLKGHIVQLLPKLKRTHLKLLNDLYPPTSNIDDRHMTHKIADIIWTYLHPSHISQKLDPLSYSQRLFNINHVLKFVSVGTNMVVTLLALHMYLGHKHKNTIYTEILQTGVLLHNSEHQHKILKSLSACYRRTSISRYGRRLSAEEVSALVYWELAYGRSLNTSDWEQEKENRCTTTTHISTVKYNCVTGILARCTPSNQIDYKFYASLRKEIAKIAQILIPQKRVTESFYNFCQRRQEWSASGSSGGSSVYIPLNDPLLKGKDDFVKKHIYDVNNVKLKVGKRGHYESITCQTMANYLYRDKPIESAVASEKMENGKSRAIYSVAPNHYSINTYATHGLEERLYLVPGLEKGLSGVKEYAQQRKRAFITADDDQECTMLDYADFNIQHTPLAQKMIFEEFARVGRMRSFHIDWINANQWVADAKDNQRVKFPHLEGVYKVEQGMFSGTRSTDLINTILNLAYFNVAVSQVQEMFKIKPDQLYHVHQGDDVWISNKSKHWAATLYQVMVTMGFVFQSSKQMFGTRRGEFLRVLYADGAAIGYAARVMTNYILRPVQGSVSIDVAEWAQTLSNSFCVMARRGFDNSYLNILYDNDMYYWVKIKAHIKDNKPIIVPDIIMMSSCDIGGLGAPRPGFSFQHNKILPEMPLYSAQVPLTSSALPSNMTDDWISYISAKLPAANRNINLEALRSGLLFCNYADVLADIGNSKFRIKYKQQWSNWLHNNRKLFLKDSIQWIYNINYKHINIKDTNAILCTTVEDIMVLAKIHKATPPKSKPTSVYGSAVVHNLLSKVESRARYMFSSSDMLARIAARSLFKSIEATAKSLGLSKIQATRWILSEHASSSMDNPDRRCLLELILNRGNSEILELMSSGSFGWLSPFLQMIHPCIVINAYNEAKQCAIATTHTFGNWSNIHSIVTMANLMALQFIRCWFTSYAPYAEISF